MKNLARFSLRLNLENEQHLRAYRILDDLDPSVFKSANNYVIQAIDAYDQILRKGINLDDGSLVNDRNEKLKEEIKDAVIAEVMNKVNESVIRVLASVIVGSNTAKVEHEIEKLHEDADQARINAAKWG